MQALSPVSGRRAHTRRRRADTAHLLVAGLDGSASCDHLLADLLQRKRFEVVGQCRAVFRVEPSHRAANAMDATGGFAVLEVVGLGVVEITEDEFGGTGRPAQRTRAALMACGLSLADESATGVLAFRAIPSAEVDVPAY